MNTLDQIEYEIVSILASYPGVYDLHSNELREQLFVNPVANAVYRAIERRLNNNQYVGVTEIVKDVESLFEPSEVVAVLQTHDHTPRGINSKVAVLVENYKKKELKFLGYELSDTSEDADQAIDAAMQKLAAIADQSGGQEWVKASDGLLMHSGVIEGREEGKVTRLATGLPDLDRMLNGGLEKQNLFIIGARPSMGKTAMGLTVALNIAQKNNVGFFSLEMSHSDIRDRMFACLGRFPLQQIQNPKAYTSKYGFGEDGFWTKVMEVVEESKALKLLINDKPNQSLARIKSECRRMKRTEGLEVVVIDYLSKIEPSDKKLPKTYQIEEITSGLKNMAKELDICVILLAQVNRGGAEKGAQPPGLVDLKDSGAIEQDGDVIGFIHRPIQLNPTLDEDWQNYALFRVAKNRQGPTGDVNLFYHGQYTRFDSWEGPAPVMPTSKSGGDIY
jgi:replicative DNA helicase